MQVVCLNSFAGCKLSEWVCRVLECFGNPGHGLGTSVVKSLSSSAETRGTGCGLTMRMFDSKEAALSLLRCCWHLPTHRPLANPQIKQQMNS